MEEVQVEIVSEEEVKLTGSRLYEFGKDEEAIRIHKEHFAKSGIEIGKHLRNIRETKNYELAGFESFQAYCKERWNFSKVYVNQLKSAVEVAEAMKLLTIVNSLPLPTGATHLKQLLRLRERSQGQRNKASENGISPEHAKRMLKVWEAIVTDNGEQVTEKIVKRYVERELGIQSVYHFTLDAWKNDPSIDPAKLSESGFNKQTDANIEWAQWSWNPVTGCKHGCDYCYARDIAERFYEHADESSRFEPMFYPSRLVAPKNTKLPPEAKDNVAYKNVFTCSMADLFGKWVPDKWIEHVMNACRDAPQWNFLFLTKLPQRLPDVDFPPNSWVGCTVDRQARVKTAEKVFRDLKVPVKFLSCEPLYEDLKFNELSVFDWIIIGGASRSSKTPAYVPPRRWVQDLETAAWSAGCSVYEKTNLLPERWERFREYPS